MALTAAKGMFLRNELAARISGAASTQHELNRVSIQASNQLG
jgi:hypothetical protein